LIEISLLIHLIITPLLHHLVKCNRVGLVVQGVVSTIQIVDSQSMKLQVLDKAPTVSVEKTDGCQVFLSKASLDTEILTAKSSETNVCLPSTTDDYVEKAVPEQFKTIIKNGSIITTPVEHAGG
jgi:adenylyl cyclase-associated protein